MARSIHDTWGVLQRAKRADWSNPDVPRAIEAEMRKNWLRQQALRDGERRARRRGALAPQPVHPDQVPVLVEDEAPYVLHAASEEDVRAVLHRLPPGSLDGLQAIKLCVDRAEARLEPRVRDPFTGRLQNELLPGAFVSSTAGVYDRESATIRIFAILCEPGKLGPVALYLKMEALRTLVHEAAHHFDATFRKRRSRWDVRDKNELWAERVEAEQAKEIVASYIGERYSSELIEMRAWLKDHGGAALSPLVLLVEEDGPRTVRSAFLRLVRSVLGGGDREGAVVAFARDLHHAGENDCARQAVRTALAKEPDSAAALAVSACISQCADKDYKAAEELCRRAVASDPQCIDAWKVLVRCDASRQKWEDAAATCERALSVVQAGNEEGWYLVETLAESHLHLADWAAVDADVARMRAWGTKYGALCADVHLAIARCWSEKWEEALALASRMLLSAKYEPWELWLKAVRFESAHRLGRPDQAGAFNGDDMTELSEQTFANAWARRIQEHVETGAR